MGFPVSDQLTQLAVVQQPRVQLRRSLRKAPSGQQYQWCRGQAWEDDAHHSQRQGQHAGSLQ